MTARQLKFTAVAGLALTIALVALALSSSLKAGAITGPEALVATASGELWVGVDQKVWRVSGEGRLLQEVALADMGLPGRPSNLLRHPDGHVVATVRDDPRLFVIDPATARVVRSITPRWPQDLQRKGREAINLAFAPDGRFAVATGGGHAVALFDADGGLLARTAPDTYRFTNGLWWSGDDVWTTDTNRFVLRRLDGRTLAVKQSVELPGDDRASYLGPARAAQVADDPSIALIRFRNDMIQGRVVVVRPGRPEVPLSHDGRLEPTDVEWLGDQVLATDGASLSIVRWMADGRPRSPFGDASVTRRLQQVAAARAALERRHAWGLRAAVAVFAIAGLLALAAQRRERQEALDALPPGAPLDLSRLGTPRLDRRALAGRLWELAWPFVTLMALAAWVQLGPLRRWIAATAPHPVSTRVTALAAFGIVAVALAIFLVRRVHRKSRSAAFEPVFNAVALRRLLAATTAQLPLADGEHVLETFMLQRHDLGKGLLRNPRDAMRWGICTSHGVRLFNAGLGEPWLDIEFGLGDVAAVATRPSRKMATVNWLTLQALRDGWLEITLADGRTIMGALTSATVRDRLAAFLGAPHAGLPKRARPLAEVSHDRPGSGPDPLRAALASLVVPGLGQWWQRRPGVGVLLFATWLGLVLALTIPIAWAVLGAHTDVPATAIAYTTLAQVGYGVVAAWDAWKAGRQARDGRAT